MRRAGFTLIELLIVLLVIAGLAAMVIPALLGSSENSRIKATRATVQMVMTMIESDAATNGLMIQIDARTQRYKWDFDYEPTATDNEHLLDGYPAQVFAGNATLVNLADQVGYEGFFGELGGNWNERTVDLVSGEIRDAWGEVLRIKFHDTNFGTSGFGVYSLGPDREDGTDDDICSWEAR